MLAQWGMTIAAGHAPELQTEPIRLGFHLAAEFATAGMLIASGWAIPSRRRWARVLGLVGLGMLMYTVIVGPGYFAQRPPWPPVVLFAVLFVVGRLAVYTLAESQPG